MILVTLLPMAEVMFKAPLPPTVALVSVPVLFTAAVVMFIAAVPVPVLNDTLLAPVMPPVRLTAEEALAEMMVKVPEVVPRMTGVEKVAWVP